MVRTTTVSDRLRTSDLRSRLMKTFIANAFTFVRLAPVQEFHLYFWFSCSRALEPRNQRNERLDHRCMSYQLSCSRPFCYSLFFLFVGLLFLHGFTSFITLTGSVKHRAQRSWNVIVEKWCQKFKLNFMHYEFKDNKLCRCAYGKYKVTRV